MGDRRQVILELDRKFEFGEYQMNYMNYRDRRIIPSTDVIVDGMTHYRSNAQGCQGPEIQFGGRVLAVFGDSAVHGVTGDSFVQHMRMPGVELLNAGIEGMPMRSVIDRVFELKADLDAVGSTLITAAVHTSWHNLLYNECDKAFWTAQLDRLIPLESEMGLAHFLLVCDICEDSIVQGYDEAQRRVKDYFLWGAMDFTTEAGRRAGMDAMQRFNDFLADYCLSRGRTVIDLGPAIRPRAIADLGTKFIDFIHPAPAAYDAIADAVTEALAPLAARAAASAAIG
jgi:hypothetical protein